jgi:flagellar hook assembly protein FlgD
VLGRMVATLVNEKQKPGNYEISWNGLTSSGEKVPSGVYFYQLRLSDGIENSIIRTKKMILTK